MLVKLADQRVLRASVVGADAELDVALLHIASPDRWRRRWAYSAPAPGHWVLSVGEPYGG